MADNFLQFSEAIEDVTPEEAEWIERQLAGLDDDEPPANLAWQSEFDDEAEFEWSLIRDGQDGPTRLWIYAECSASPDSVGSFVQAFLKRSRPQAHFTLTWACTCSKPRLGEFSGGAIFVTADEVRYLNAGDWIDEQVRQHDRVTLPAIQIIAQASVRGLKPEQLDELVHDAKCAEAATINNGSLYDQIRYLVASMGADAVRDALTGLLPDQNA